MKLLPLIVVLLTFSCTQGIDLRHVDLGNTFHDNNSKVWIIDKYFIHDLNVYPGQIYQKEVLFFYSDGKFNLIPMRQLGEVEPRRGKFTVESQTRKLLLEFNNRERWSFSIEQICQDSMLLRRTNSTKDSVCLQLKPFPYF